MALGTSLREDGDEAETSSVRGDNGDGTLTGTSDPTQVPQSSGGGAVVRGSLQSSATHAAFHAQLYRH